MFGKRLLLSIRRVTRVVYAGGYPLTWLRIGVRFRFLRDLMYLLVEIALLIFYNFLAHKG